MRPKKTPIEEYCKVCEGLDKEFVRSLRDEYMGSPEEALKQCLYDKIRNETLPIYMRQRYGNVINRSDIEKSKIVNLINNYTFPVHICVGFLSAENVSDVIFNFAKNNNISIEDSLKFFATGTLAVKI